MERKQREEGTDEDGSRGDSRGGEAQKDGTCGIHLLRLRTWEELSLLKAWRVRCM